MISVIIPVYNAEKYLKQCIESVLNQTYTDFELILVDDGSTDSSALICDEYSRKDNRVLVIHQKNQGRCVARNVGMECARGEFIQLMDDDDAIHRNMLQVLYDNIKCGDYDFSMVKAQYVPENYPHDLLDRSITDVQPLVMTRDDCFKQLYGAGEGKTQFIFAWNKLYRKEFINGLFFRNTASEDTLYEDTCKLSEAIYNETRHEFIHSKLPLTYKLGLMGLYHIPSLYSMMISAFGLIKKLRNRIM